MRTGTWIAVVLLALVCGVGGGALGSYLLLGRTPTQPALLRPTAAPPPAVVEVATERDAIVQAVARTAPAVVTVTSVVRAPARTGPFGIPFGAPQERQGIGSGFLFDYEGRTLILTNAHVVAGADQLTVRTPAGEEFAARPLGLSPEDLAVLEPVDPPADLPTLSLGDSEQIPVGAWVIAVGSPFGFDNTVTVGVVSRKGFVEIGPGQSRDLIQTDAAINSGNSGGPLLDLGGNVIGVNQMIFSPTQTNLGIGFAIPINLAREMMYFLVHRGPWVGIATMPNSPGLSGYLGLAIEHGAVIMQVVPNSPAVRAGLQAGDVVLQIDGQAITSPEDVRKAILARRIGDKISFGVHRGGEQMTVTVEAGQVPEGMY